LSRKLLRPVQCHRSLEHMATISKMTNPITEHMQWSATSHGRIHNGIPRALSWPIDAANSLFTATQRWGRTKSRISRRCKTIDLSGHRMQHRQYGKDIVDRLIPRLLRSHFFMNQTTACMWAFLLSPCCETLPSQ